MPDKALCYCGKPAHVFHEGTPGRGDFILVVRCKEHWKELIDYWFPDRPAQAVTRA